MTLRLFLLSALCLLPPLASAASLRWEHHPGLTLAGSLGLQTGDFDGDGRDEAALTTTTRPNAIALAIIGNEDDGLALRQILPVDLLLTGAITVAEIEGQARMLVPVQLDDGYAVIEYGGSPLRELRRLALPLFTSPVAVADIDGDGDLDVLAFQETFPYAENPVALLDYATGDTLWTDTAMSHGRAIVTQLDGDAALEIVVPGIPGRVLDGATRLLEWTYPAGFDAALVTGEFDTAHPGPEFAALPFDHDGILTLFSTDPYSPLRETSTAFAAGGAVAEDIDSDGRDDILLGARDQAGVYAYTPSTDSLRALPTPDLHPWRIATGDLQGSAAPELIVAASQSFETQDALRVVDAASGDTLLAVPETIGPYAALAVGDFDADGRVDVLHAQDGRGIDPNMRNPLCQLDASTGRRERCLAVPFLPAAVVAAPVSGQFDAAPDADVAVLAGPAVFVFDGETLTQSWSVEPGSPVYEELEAVAAMRYNDDAIDDIVVFGSHIYVLDGRDGEELWRSVELDGASFGGEKTLALANLDNDPVIEIVVTNGDSVYAFDAQTRLLDWSLTPDTEIGRFVTWGTGDACRFGLYHPSGAFQAYHCDDRMPDGAERTFPVNANLLRILDAEGKTFVAASAGRILTIASDDSTRVWASGLGAFLGRGNSGAVIPLGGDRYDLVVGSDLLVARIAIHVDLVFSDAFE